MKIASKGESFAEAGVSTPAPAQGNSPWLAKPLILLGACLPASGMPVVNGQEGQPAGVVKPLDSSLDSLTTPSFRSPIVPSWNADAREQGANAQETSGQNLTAQEPNPRGPDASGLDGPALQEMRQRFFNILKDELRVGDPPETDPATVEEVLRGQLFVDVADVLNGHLERKKNLNDGRSFEKELEVAREVAAELKARQVITSWREWFAALPDWKEIMFTGGCSAALVISLVELAKKSFGYVRALTGRRKLVDAWAKFAENMTLDAPSSSGAVAGALSVAEVRGVDLTRCAALAVRVPSELREIFKRFGIAPQVTVWARGMQSTADGVEFTGMTQRSVGVSILEVDRLKYLVTHIGRRVIERHPALGAFVASVIGDAHRALIEGRWPERGYNNNVSEWRETCAYFAKWTDRLGLKNESESFAALKQASRLPKPLFEKYLDLEKRNRQIKAFPFSVDRKLEEFMIVYESLVEELESDKQSRSQNERLLKLLTSFGLQADRTFDLLTRYAAKELSPGASVRNASADPFDYTGNFFDEMDKTAHSREGADTHVGPSSGAEGDNLYPPGALGGTVAFDSIARAMAVHEVLRARVHACQLREL